MDVYNAIKSRRTIRRFKQKEIDFKLLKKFVNSARLAPSAANLQPLEYVIVNDEKLCEKIFKTTGWAGYLKPKWRPKENQRPTAYIVVLKKDKDKEWTIRDASLASENIVLNAESENIGSCLLLNIDKKKIRDILNIPNHLFIDILIALGYKDENCIAENMRDSIKYYRDENDILHVPKRKLDDIVQINKF